MDMADITKWLSENYLWLFFIFACICLRQEFNRVDRRIDAVIEILKQRGIKIVD
jgi:hypothetical protein